MQPINIAVIGCGYWGLNLIRNFNALSNCNIKACCDISTNQLNRMKQLYNHIETTTDYHDIISSEKIDVVTIATPVRTHAEIAKACLAADRPILVEKPVTASVKECNELIALANKKILSSWQVMRSSILPLLTKCLKSSKRVNWVTYFTV